VQFGFFPGVKRPELEAENFNPFLSYSLYLLSLLGFIVWTGVRRNIESQKKFEG
jgi:hypothetical protein